MPRRWEVAVVLVGWVYAPDPETASWAVQQAVRGAAEPEVLYSRAAGIVQKIPVTRVNAYSVDELGPVDGGEPLPETDGRLVMEEPVFPGSARTMTEAERSAALSYTEQVARECEERTSWPYRS